MFTETSRRCGGFRRKRNKIFQIVNAVWENATPCKNRLVESVAWYFFFASSRFLFVGDTSCNQHKSPNKILLRATMKPLLKKKVEKDAIQ